MGRRPMVTCSCPSSWRQSLCLTKLLQSLGSGNMSLDAVRDLHEVMDIVLMATKPLGLSVGFMLVLHRHLWLTLADLKDSDRKELITALITPSSHFSDNVELDVE
ncbi:histone -like protein [Labeo rohita]|uniref:Histone-like protein n=1 Tax=Labeo rohita TaxID=84645 RepID=A0A498MAG9_LABRO|nr:histone -like protein [Labeo rohita]